MEFSFFTMVANASAVAKIVLVLLFLMSIGSWGIMIQKVILLSSAQRKALAGTKGFENAASLRDAVQVLGTDIHSPLFRVAQKGVNEFNRSKELGNDSNIIVDNVRRALRQGVGLELSNLQSSFSVLATISNTAPFIGLFGTVWGIMHSFHSIGLSKSASLATVAPGISEALVATAIGLAVAVPATVGFNIFLGKLARIDTLLVNFASVFLNRVQREINAHNSRNSNPAPSNFTPNAAAGYPNAREMQNTPNGYAMQNTPGNPGAMPGYGYPQNPLGNGAMNYGQPAPMNNGGQIKYPNSVNNGGSER